MSNQTVFIRSNAIKRFIILLISFISFIFSSNISLASDIYPNLLDALSLAAEMYFTNSKIDNVSFDDQYTIGINGQRYKHLLYLGATPVGIGLEALLFIDIDDYKGITKEGSDYDENGNLKESYVTMWVTGGVTILGISLPPLVSLGWTRVPIIANGEDPNSLDSHSLLYANAPFIGLSTLKLDANSGVQLAAETINQNTFPLSGSLGVWKSRISITRVQISFLKS